MADLHIENELGMGFIIDVAKVSSAGLFSLDGSHNSKSFPNLK
jgi:hypothetical protein